MKTNAIVALVLTAGAMQSTNAEIDVIAKSRQLVQHMHSIGAERNLQAPSEEQADILYDCAAKYNSKNFFRCSNSLDLADSNDEGNTDGVEMDQDGNYVVNKASCEAAFSDPYFICFQYIDPDQTLKFFGDFLKNDFGGKCDELQGIMKDAGFTGTPETEKSVEDSEQDVEEAKPSLSKLQKFAEDCDKVVPGISQAKYKAVPESASSSFGVSVLVSLAAFLGLRGN